MKINSLFLRKLGVAFLVGFGGVLVPAVATILSSAEAGTPSNLTKSFVISLIAGAFAAGLRAVLVLIPGLNLVPSDAEPVLTKTPPPPAAK